MNKKVGKTSLLNLGLVGCASIMGLVYILLFLGEFVFLEGGIGGWTLHGGASGYDIIFKENPVAGLLVAWIFALLALIALIGVIVLNFLPSVKLPKLCVPAIVCFAGLLLLVGGILAFSTTGLLEGGKLGVGAVFAGIFGILGFLAAGAGAFLLYKE